MMWFPQGCILGRFSLGKARHCMPLLVHAVSNRLLTQPSYSKVDARINHLTQQKRLLSSFFSYSLPGCLCGIRLGKDVKIIQCWFVLNLSTLSQFQQQQRGMVMRIAFGPAASTPVRRGSAEGCVCSISMEIMLQALG
jgi:hypothetical protein